MSISNFTELDLIRRSHDPKDNFLIINTVKNIASSRATTTVLFVGLCVFSGSTIDNLQTSTKEISAIQHPSKSIISNIFNDFEGKETPSEAYDAILRGVVSTSKEGTDVKSQRSNSVRFVYGTLTILGLLSTSLSALSTYVVPFLNENVAKVLLPLSFIYLAMIAMDYLTRGRGHGRS